jgi:hypothetical protein
MPLIVSDPAPVAVPAERSTVIAVRDVDSSKVSVPEPP